MLLIKVNNVVFNLKKEEYENKCRKMYFMDPGCSEKKMHFNIMMHKDGNKISVITNFNSKPEYCSVGLCVWVKEVCNC
jgi:hypothetical protein